MTKKLIVLLALVVGLATNLLFLKTFLGSYLTGATRIIIDVNKIGEMQIELLVIIVVIALIASGIYVYVKGD